MRISLAGVGLVAAAILFGGPAMAYDANDPANCNGAEWDQANPLLVAKVSTGPRVSFIKSPYDDGFTASSCPAATAACERKAYLVAGDLVLAGRKRGPFTCVSYQSPLAKKQIWVNGWLPSAALTPVLPMPNPEISDWVGTWYHPGGPIEIRKAKGGKLHVEGGMTVPTAKDFHNGDFAGDVMPKGDTIAFVDQYGECRVRLQRIGPWLLAVDNSGCGGAGVSFTGLYRRKK